MRAKLFLKSTWIKKAQLQYWPSRAGVTPEVNLINPLPAGEEVCK